MSSEWDDHEILTHTRNRPSTLRSSLDVCACTIAGEPDLQSDKLWQQLQSEATDARRQHSSRHAHSSAPNESLRQRGAARTPALLGKGLGSSSWHSGFSSRGGGADRCLDSGSWHGNNSIGGSSGGGGSGGDDNIGDERRLGRRFSRGHFAAATPVHGGWP